MPDEFFRLFTEANDYNAFFCIRLIAKHPDARLLQNPSARFAWLARKSAEEGPAEPSAPER